mmetsp:Transcript_4861/g.12442  ORF Transcript_4861/g.12442 Transcript_4861/m.12442 type:complete len:273 (+) Transcript_4861:238-1056(+)
MWYCSISSSGTRLKSTYSGYSTAMAGLSARNSYTHALVNVFGTSCSPVPSLPSPKSKETGMTLSRTRPLARHQSLQRAPTGVQAAMATLQTRQSTLGLLKLRSSARSRECSGSAKCSRSRMAAAPLWHTLPARECLCRRWATHAPFSSLGARVERTRCGSRRSSRQHCPQSARESRTWAVLSRRTGACVAFSRCHAPSAIFSTLGSYLPSRRWCRTSSPPKTNGLSWGATASGMCSLQRWFPICSHTSRTRSAQLRLFETRLSALAAETISA